MHTEHEELAGRIDGVARALLHVVAELEMAGIMDGPRLSQRWQSAAPKTLPSSLRTLQQLAARLDDARQIRRRVQRSSELRMRRTPDLLH